MRRLLIAGVLSVFTFFLVGGAGVALAAGDTSGLFEFDLWRGTGDGGINTCNVGKPCTFCDAIVMLSNAIRIVFSFSLVAATVIIAVGGFFAVIDPADPGRRKKGLDMMKSAGWGILIIIIAYPLISMVLRFLVFSDDTATVSNLMPWSQITCK